MNATDLAQLGITETQAKKLTFEAIGKRMETGIGIDATKLELEEVIANPADFENNPYWGELASKLVNLNSFVPRVLRERRLNSGLPQREVAFLCGLDPMTISRVERGDHPPSLTTFWLLAKAYHTTPAQLCLEIDKHTDGPPMHEDPPPLGYRKASLPRKITTKQR